MKTVATLLAVLLVSSASLLAHGGNDHVRGVVTQISAHEITVHTTTNSTRTLTITEKTLFKRAGKDAQVSDLKVGDRVVIDVPAKKNDALLVQIGAAAAKPPVKP